MKKKALCILLSLATAVTMTGGASAVLAEETEDATLSDAVSTAEDASSAATDALSLSDATVTEIHPLVDGESMSVTWYEDVYMAYPNREEDQLISIYVPENATADSPIIFCVNNAGWQADSYTSRTKVLGTEEETEDVGDYSSTSDTDKVGKALSEGYVIVSYGCRSRANEATEDGEYQGHSPATITDTKAAIRYLRYNADLLPAGNTDKIVITGTSGGGALSSVIAASANSSDYYESLYEIGAAGIELDADGNYVSTIDDGVFAVIAYCPITDLANANYAYEWTYHDTRERLEDTTEDELALSEELAALYTDYLAGLGLKTEDGEDLTTDNLKDCIISLMETEIEESIEEYGIEQMQADIEEFDNANNVTWLTLNEDGTYTYDYDEHLYWLASHTALKGVPAFSNRGLSESLQTLSNEDSLFGTTTDEYSPFIYYSWDNDTLENNVGLDDTGLTWDEYIETEDGQYLLQQIRMTNAIEYLNDDSADTDIAANWYVRFGMADRDTSFAVEASLYYSLLNNDSVDSDTLSFEYAWLQRHKGDYDVQEAYAWLEGILR
ncbi:MAG: hypothetical protein LUF78_12490 [Clostridiales bacterium]|nr:hypothetical protein [Clostridiales bacterium]